MRARKDGLSAQQTVPLAVPQGGPHRSDTRRACSLADLDRSTFQYPKREGGDEPLRKRLRELAGERRRFGYRRLGILLAREGLGANHKKLYRLYTEERLAVKRRRGRKRAMGCRATIWMRASRQSG